MPPLYALEPGDTAVVAVPGSTDPEVVAFLGTLGLRPGVRVEVKEKHPFDGPLVLRVDGKDAQSVLLRSVAVRVREAQAGNADTPVVISADRAVKYEAVVKVMDTLQRAGVQRVGLSVKSGG